MEIRSVTIPVVAAALINSEEKVLLQQRSAGTAHGGLWEFPGGKVEQGETLHEALIRELGEELALDITADSLLPVSFAAEAGEPVYILLFVCRAWQGVPQANAAQALRWFDASEFSQLAMPPLDVPLAQAVKELLKKGK